MQKADFTAVALGALLLLAGCQGGGALVGKWRPIQPGSPEETPVAITGNDLELKGNGEFHMQGFPAISGKWKREGGKVILTPEKLADRSVKDFKPSPGAPSPAEPIILEVGKDGKTLKPASTNKNVITFSWMKAPQS